MCESPGSPVENGLTVRKRIGGSPMSERLDTETNRNEFSISRLRHTA